MSSLQCLTRVLQCRSDHGPEEKQRENHLGHGARGENFGDTERGGQYPGLGFCGWEVVGYECD